MFSVKVLIQLFSLQLWMNSRADWLFNFGMATRLEEEKLRNQTCKTLPKTHLVSRSARVEGLGTHTHTHTHTYIYIYIYIYISLNNIDIPCIHIFGHILLSHHFHFMASGGNCRMKRL